MDQLSPTQAKVMSWLGKKWSAQPSHGEVWTINGGSERQGVTCSTRTLMVLKRKGLVEQDVHGCWVATDEGKQLVKNPAWR